MPQRVSAALVVGSLVLLAAAAANGQQLRSNRIAAKPYDLNEIRADFKVPEGFKVAGQQWIPLTAGAAGQ